MSGSKPKNRSHLTLLKTDRNFLNWAVSPNSRPALRGGVKRGGATALSSTKIEPLRCPEMSAKKSEGGLGERSCFLPQTRPDTAFQGAGGVRVPPGPWGGHSRPHRGGHGGGRLFPPAHRSSSDVLALASVLMTVWALRQRVFVVPFRLVHILPLQLLERGASMRWGAAACPG